MGKRSLLRLCAAGYALVAIATGCGNRSRENTLEHASQFQNEGVLVVGLEAMPQQLDPRYGVDAYSQRAQGLMYQGLFKVDRDGSVVPDLVKEYALRRTSDSTVVVASLKPARFHNGAALAVSDVVYSYKSMMASNSPRSAALRELASVRAITMSAGATEAVEFQFTADSGPVLLALTIGIIAADAQEGELPPGTGHFTLKERSSERLVFARYGGALTGALNQIVMRHIGHDGARASALETGEIDLVQNAVAPQDLPMFARHPRVQVDRFDGNSISYLGFNHNDPVLADVRVRKAISHAVDREAIVHHLLGDTAAPIGTIVPRSNWAYLPVTVDAFDPERSRALLDQAGLVPNEEGIRFALSYKTSTNRVRVRIAEAIASMLGKVGIEVKVHSMDFGTFFDQIKRGQFQLYSLTWTGIIEPDLMYYAFAEQSIPPDGANRGFFRDLTLSTTLEQARILTERNQRIALYHQAQKRVAKLYPYAILWDQDFLVVRQSFVPKTRPLPDGNWRWLNDITIPQVHAPE